ncbi:Vacuolar protein sorting-associated protein 13A [Cichlidogyrus casuarinus]|uniref:Vacuolar protein sorting-associated protein 13A n=1 Tax=Cichlidogyrus casuarinus TaxID=1844966 RepID=A0ABD2QLB4_9PLAT
MSKSEGNERVDMPLVTANKEQEESSDLLEMNLVIAQKMAPEFVSKYKNTRHSMVLDLKKVHIELHQEHFSQLVHFLLELGNKLYSCITPPPVDDRLAQTAQSKAWAQNIGDAHFLQELIQREKQALIESQKILPANITAASTVSSIAARKDERRKIRLNAVILASKHGFSLHMNDLFITQWEIQAMMQQATLTISSEHSPGIYMKATELKSNLFYGYLKTDLTVSLSSLSVKDSGTHSVYRNVAWISEADKFFLFNYLNFTPEASVLFLDQEEKLMQGLPEEYAPIANSIKDQMQSVDGADTAIRLTMGKLNLVLINTVIMRMFSFANTFKLATQLAIQRARMVSNMAKAQLEEQISRPTSMRLMLDLTIHAPRIFLPISSSKPDALCLDFGQITCSNHSVCVSKTNWKKEPKNDDETEDCDKIVVNLKQLQASRVTFKRKREFLVHDFLLKPTQLELSLVRKLQELAEGETRRIPNIYLQVQLDQINLTLNQIGYTLLCNIYTSNIVPWVQYLGTDSTDSESADVEQENVISSSEVTTSDESIDDIQVMKETIHSLVPYLKIHVQLNTLNASILELDYVCLHLYNDHLSFFRLPIPLPVSVYTIATSIQTLMRTAGPPLPF